MAYQLRYDRRFKNSLSALPGDIRVVARRIVAQLSDDPRPSRAKELEDHPTYYRLWLPRQHRLVWQVIDHEQVVDLLYIGPKSPDLYERLGFDRE